MGNLKDNLLEFDDDSYDYWGGLVPFTPGKYYVADETGFVLGEYDSFIAAKTEAGETDVILVAYNNLGSHFTRKHEPKCDKIIVDFDKKELTIGNKDVTLCDVQYEKDNVYELEQDDLKSWSQLLRECRQVADNVEVLGTPPINGKDITNEMSDL